MKANEAPEKLYFDVNNNLIGLYDSAILGMFSAKNTETAIEYVRADAFIEKACEFLKSYRQEIYNGEGYIAGIINDKTIEDFVNYMEGE